MVSMAPLVTPISKDLEISNSTMGLILGAWPLTYIVAALPAGILLAFADLVRLRTVRLILAMAIGIFFINHALNNWLPEILINRGLDAVAAGYWASIPAIVGIVGALVVPRLAIPEHRLLVMAALFVATLLASLMLQGTPGPVMFLGLILQGIARGSMMTVAILILMEAPSVPKERLGLAGGLFFTVAEVGGVLGPLSFGILSDFSGNFVLPLASITVVSVTLLLVLLALRATPGAIAR